MIETYYHAEEGCHPFLIREGWQVAQLNYVEKHGLDDIDQVEAHKDTDEVFILFKGNAVLVEAQMEAEGIRFDCLCMKPGVTYNVSAGAWHEIAMDRDAEIIIVERANTHKQDCSYIRLTDSQKQDLYSKIKEQLS
ncbi:MAG: hypothetical protein LUD46_23495 [Parabacteroides sp.]|nr:hypothetical protein [Parabacteroides sp.]